MTQQRWHPSATLETVRLRARMLADARGFFAERGITEVETPTLSPAATSDPNLTSLQTGLATHPEQPLFLHTSPELPMKRLLAAGYGDIYQICRVYRDGELGRAHQPEFTLLEWYRVGMSDAQLRTEVAALIARLLGPARASNAVTLTYCQAFERYLAVDPLDPDGTSVYAALAAKGHRGLAPNLTRPALLDLAFSLEIAPRLGRGQPTFIIDYPRDQAALAALQPNGLARRFELFIEGLELANGFAELTDPMEQRRRFQDELETRARRGQARHPIDEQFLAALEAGMPECAGVAVGFDRLVMLAAGVDHIDAVLTFPHGQDGF